MNESRNDDDQGLQDQSLQELLREVGAREAPSAQATAEVRRAVHDEWLALVRWRQRRNRRIGFGIAAGVAAAIVSIAVSFHLAPDAAPVAMVARVEGALQAADPGNDRWHDVAQGATLTAGVILRTDDSTRVALNLIDGASLRIDAGSVIEFKTADTVALDHGAVYVDAGADIAAATSKDDGVLAIETRYGTVRHLGTQYEVRTRRAGMEVSVREGRVSIVSGEGRYEGVAGERLIVPQQGAVERTAIAAQDAQWLWATGIAPVFDIERQPLSRFLDWAARETGKQVRYASPQVQTRAEQLILRGSVNNLPPEQALAAVLATTPFTQTQTATSIQIAL